MAALIGILTVSDTRTAETDQSGPAAEQVLRSLGYTAFDRRLCADEIEQIQAALADMAVRCQAIFTTGGTGFSPRDVTPEATRALVDRRADNLNDLMRLKGLESTALSYLSRGISGMIGKTLVVNLPGSPSGARHGILAIGHLLKPILEAQTP